MDNDSDDYSSTVKRDFTPTDQDNSGCVRSNQHNSYDEN